MITDPNMTDFTAEEGCSIAIRQAIATNSSYSKPFKEGSLWHITHEFEDECRAGGARQAYEAAYKNLFARFARNRPTKDYLRMEGVIDEECYKQR